MTRPKPIRLQVQTQLISAEPSDAVKIEPGSRARSQGARSEKKPGGAPAKPVQAPASGFDLRARYETKGRGGQPVFVLYAFTDRVCGAQDSFCQSPRAFAQKLKNTLSCGGTCVEGPDAMVTLQFRDRERLVKTLEKWGLRVQFSGG